MALSILDGTQTATTLSTILSSGQHITAHTVVSLGTQAITDMRGAVSGSVVSISNFPSSQVISGTVTANPTGIQTIAGTVTANPTGTQTIAGTVTANLGLNEIPYVKANINITQTASGDTLVSNVFLRRIGQYKYQSISGWANGEDESYVEIELKAIAGFPDAQLQWQASSFGGLNTFPDGTFATVLPQNAGSDNGDPFPPITFTPASGFTGTMSVSYEQPSIQPISGTVTIGSALPAGTNRIGVVTIGAGTVTIGAGTAQIGSVTASGTVTANVPFADTFIKAYGAGGFADTLEGYDEGLPQKVVAVHVKNTSGEIFGSNAFPISGTVTANSSNGSLTTRFGSVVTANTAFATSAVTNANRKYLLIQNITTASNVITVGIGFTPTTTQGIQLFAGAGLTFEGSYIPTGAVNLLSSVTASCYTILEA